MSELVAFLEARLAEDEAVARREDDPMTSREDAWTLTGPFDPARVLREVTAKRTILALHTVSDGYPPTCAVCDGGDWDYDLRRTEHQPYPCDTLRALAAPFSDHPDFQEQWR